MTHEEVLETARTAEVDLARLLRAVIADQRLGR